jgi:hypothetical protein
LRHLIELPVNFRLWGLMWTQRLRIRSWCWKAISRLLLMWAQRLRIRSWCWKATSRLPSTSHVGPFKEHTP